MGASKSSRALRREALKKISRACHCSPQQAPAYLHLAELLARKDHKAVADFFGFGEEELDFVMKKKPAENGAAGKKTKG